MLDDDDFLPISALQHYIFCPRQCGLIHLEREWKENILTARGSIEHERVHDGYKEFRRGRRQLSGVTVRSRALQLQGQIDVLELELIDADGPDNLPSFGLKGCWDVYPVEFKHGEPKQSDCDRVQLCAQAICVEEMTRVPITTASLFYHRIRRREDVLLDEALRRKTTAAAEGFRAMFESGATPPPVYGRQCRSCSLIDICMPKKMARNATRYHQLLFTQQEVSD